MSRPKQATQIASNMYTYPIKGGVVLYSYEERVAYRTEQGEFFVVDQFYSSTTTKHISKWRKQKSFTLVSQEYLDSL